MFDYSYDPETGGLLLNDATPVSSKEPRPVYAEEMRMLHMDDMYVFRSQSDRPYLWAEAATYYYRGKIIARTRGGTLCEAPVVDYLVETSAEGEKVAALPQGTVLEAVDIDRMVQKNAGLLSVIEQHTVKRIYDYFKRYRGQMDTFHVAFSGGKDSIVLLELVKKALPKDAFIVVFGDTKMEFPDTYDVIDAVEWQCKEEGIGFYRAESHLSPQESWRAIGPPSRTLRWCCSVHKAAPQTLTIRKVLGKSDYVGCDFVGVRAAESLRRSEYEYECFGKKQRGQYSLNPILDWSSAEIWLTIYSRKLLINRAYKKGNSRAGCLFCPNGGDKSNGLRILSYPNEVNTYLDLIRATIGEKSIESYISNGGWINRRNGRDLIDNPQRYFEDEQDGRLSIRVLHPSSDWKEWIKTLGVLPFRYTVVETEHGYTVSMPSQYKGTSLGKYFRQVFRKAAYCIGCRVCEANCSQGCISFEHGLQICDCRHCMKCHDIERGCLVYHSLTQPVNGGRVMRSFNTYADHAPKHSWIVDFFEAGNQFFDAHTLGPMQIRFFRAFLFHASLIDKNGVTPFYDLTKKLGFNSESAWGLIYIQLAYNSQQIRWYIDHLTIGSPCSSESLQNQLEYFDVSKKDARSIVKAYKRLCDTPLGTVLHMGTTTGKNVDSLVRTKCSMRDDRVLLYALYRYAEACEDYHEFSLSRLMDTNIDSVGISPVKLFGYTEDEMIAMLGGLSQKYPAFIHVTFTHQLNKISLRDDKTADDVLTLFNE